MASHHNSNPGSRAHITLNPYSTQLVENINMMMPDKSSGSSSSATNSSSSTTSTTLGRSSHQQQCQMNLNPHLVNLTTSLRRGKHY
jgi:cellulase/cellobiase CelA1